MSLMHTHADMQGLVPWDSDWSTTKNFFILPGRMLVTHIQDCTQPLTGTSGAGLVVVTHDRGSPKEQQNVI